MTTTIHPTKKQLYDYVKGNNIFPNKSIAFHLRECQPCLDQILEIDPTFLSEGKKLEDFRRRMVTVGSHFSDSEINSYIDQSFDLKKRKSMQGHFSHCSICCGKLKEKDADYLLHLVRDNKAFNRLNENQKNELWTETKSTKKPLLGGFTIFRPVYALGLLLMGLMGFSIFGLIRFQSDTDVAFESNKQVMNQDNIPLPPQLFGQPVDRQPNKNLDPIGEPKLDPIGEPKNETNLSKTESTKFKVKSADLSKNRKSTAADQKPSSKEIIAQTRSLNGNCDKSLPLAISPDHEVITEIKPVLNWKPVKNAVDYRVYIADSNNNMIERGEVVKGTVYQIKTALELNKKYEWKVSARLADNSEVYSRTANFSIGTKAQKIKIIKKNEQNNQNRCLSK